MIASFAVPAPLADVLQRPVLGNSIQSWLTAALTAGVVLLLGIVLRRLLVTRLAIVSARTRMRFDDVLFEVIKHTRIWAIVCVAIFSGLSSLVLPMRIAVLVPPLLKLVLLWQAAVWGGAIVTFWVLHQLAHRTGTHERSSVAMISAIGVGVKTLIWMLIGLTALKAVFNIEITALITGLGVSGIAVALAVQNILGDIFAALAIVFDKPFDVGDAIKVGDISGTVEQIGLKTTRLRSLTGEQVIIGNADLLKSRLHNYRRMYQRRVAFVVDVPLTTSPAVVEQIPRWIEAIVAAQDPVKFDRSHVAAFTEWSIRIETVYYVLSPDYAVHVRIQQAVNVAILKRFAEAGVRLENGRPLAAT